jgi:hypothetical protein
LLPKAVRRLLLVWVTYRDMPRLVTTVDVASWYGSL